MTVGEEEKHLSILYDSHGTHEILGLNGSKFDRSMIGLVYDAVTIPATIATTKMDGLTEVFVCKNALFREGLKT